MIKNCRRISRLLILSGLIFFYINGLVACTNKPRLETWQTYPQIVIPQMYETNLVWKTSFGKQNRFDISNYQLAEDTSNYYLVNDLGKLVALAKDDAKGVYGGREYIYETQTNQTLISGPVLFEDMLLAGTAEGFIIGFAKHTGEEVWRLNVTSEVVSTPTIINSRAYVRTQNGVLYAIDPLRGLIIWKKYHTNPNLILRGFSQPSHYKDTIIMGLPNGEVEAIDIATSNTRWITRISIPKGRTDLERLTDTHAKVLIDQDNAYAILSTGNPETYKLASITAEDGKILWIKDYTATLDMLAIDNSLLVLDSDGVIYSLDKKTGEQNWDNEDLTGRYLSAYDEMNGIIAVSDDQGWLHWIDIENGKRLHSRAHVRTFTQEGKRIGNIYFQSDGSLIVLDKQADISRYSPLTLVSAN